MNKKYIAATKPNRLITSISNMQAVSDWAARPTSYKQATVLSRFTQFLQKQTQPQKFADILTGPMKGIAAVDGDELDDFGKPAIANGKALITLDSDGVSQVFQTYFDQDSVTGQFQLIDADIQKTREKNTRWGVLVESTETMEAQVAPDKEFNMGDLLELSKHVRSKLPKDIQQRALIVYEIPKAVIEDQDGQIFYPEASQAYEGELKVEGVQLDLSRVQLERVESPDARILSISAPATLDALVSNGANRYKEDPKEHIHTHVRYKMLTAKMQAKIARPDNSEAPFSFKSSETGFVNLHAFECRFKCSGGRLSINIGVLPEQALNQ